MPWPLVATRQLIDPLAEDELQSTVAPLGRRFLNDDPIRFEFERWLLVRKREELGKRESLGDCH
jgi:hypothetical protein